MTPEVSVVMPVRNGAAFLKDAVQSILSQTFSNFEFIIIDDGSSDETPMLLARFASLDPRIRLFRTRGEGIVTALNLGIEAARADLVARMDSDDVSVPERFAIQTAALGGMPSHVAIGSCALTMDSNGRDTGTMMVPAGLLSANMELLRRNIFVHPTMMIRRTTMLASGLYRPACIYAEDYDLWLRLSEIGEMTNTVEPLIRFRIHSDQTSKTRRLTQRAATALARQIAIRRRNEREEGIDMGLPLPAALVTFLKQRAEGGAVTNRGEAKDIEVIMREVHRELDTKLVGRLIRLMRASRSWKSTLLLRLRLALTSKRNATIDSAIQWK